MKILPKSQMGILASQMVGFWDLKDLSNLILGLMQPKAPRFVPPVLFIFPFVPSFCSNPSPVVTGGDNLIIQSIN